MLDPARWLRGEHGFCASRRAVAGFCRIRKSRGKRPGTWKPFWWKIIYFISSLAQEFERTQIDLDASEAPGPFRDSWESHPRLLISPTSNEDLQPAVLRTTRKPPALTHLRL